MPLAVPVGYVLTALGTLRPDGLQESEFMPPPGDACAPTIFHPVGKTSIDEDLATVCGTWFDTTEKEEEARAIYLGRAQKKFTGAEVVVDVLLSAVNTTWCEAAICKGDPVLCDGPSTLTVVKAVDTSGDWSVPGPVSTDFGALSIARGDHLWFAWSIKGDLQHPLPIFRAFLADTILSGLSVFRSGTQLTTMPPNKNFDRLGKTTRTIDSLVGCS